MCRTCVFLPRASPKRPETLEFVPFFSPLYIFSFSVFGPLHNGHWNAPEEDRFALEGAQKNVCKHGCHFGWMYTLRHRFVTLSLPFSTSSTLAQVVLPWQRFPKSAMEKWLYVLNMSFYYCWFQWSSDLKLQSRKWFCRTGIVGSLTRKGKSKWSVMHDELSVCLW